MYDFHYNIIKKNFNAELLFTDTDSLTYEVKSKNVYEEFFKWKDLFDFRNYSKDSTFFDETNKKVTGKMKDEFGGVIVSEFVGLKSKMYSMKKTDAQEYNTAKGVSIVIMIGHVAVDFLTSQNWTYWKITNTKHEKGKKLQNVHNLHQPGFQIMT